MTESSSATDRPHILIVSDDEGLSTFLGEGLVYGGFWTSVVASGIQTLEVFRLRSFDLVLLDSQLGDLSAIEVVQRLRGKSDRAAPTDVGARTDAPILIIVDFEGELTKSEIDSAGANGTLAPPLDLEILVPALHQFIRQWRMDHPANREGHLRDL